MKKKIKLIIMFFICLMIGSGVLLGAVQGKEQRPTISAGERAQIAWEVQNVMSKHNYYKQVEKLCEEMEKIWVSEYGPYGKTAKWTSHFGVIEGMTLNKFDYCHLGLKEHERVLAEFSKKYPAIKNNYENLGIGVSYSMKTNLTPVIEVAGDGKTAKGTWYSIGIGVIPDVNAEGKTTIRSNWACEKYAADFVKDEDGKWKIWHFLTVFEPSPVEAPQEYPPMDSMYPRPTGADGVLLNEEMSETFNIFITRAATDTEFYEWTPKVAPKIYPRLPEPYYTFSETFSY